MFRSTALGVLLPMVAAGCSEWPRPGNMGDDPGYLTPGDPAAAAVVSYSERTEPSPDWPNLATETSGTTVPVEISAAIRVTGVLDSAGWRTDTSGEFDPGCGVGPITTPPGYYDGDSDAFGTVELVEDAYLCVRGRLETEENVGWDMTLIDLGDAACPKPFQVGDAVPGTNLNRSEAVWGANVPPGKYALVVGAYYPVTAEFDVAYEIGLSLWAPFEGSAEQCPLLDQDSE